MIILLIVFLLLTPLTSGAGQSAVESDRIKTIRSLKKVDDFPLYTMFYYGSYDLPDFAPETSPPFDMRCTCFATKTDQGAQLLGRNFDWEDHPALLLYTDPQERYASVSMVDISYLGYSKSDEPSKNPGGLFRAPLYPFDGMNERGLAVGMMAVPAAQASRDPQKQTVGSLLIIRLLLDRAKNLEEAIAIFRNFNIDFQGGPPLHYFMADRSGRSAVVEFVDHKISLLRNTQAWQVATNFNLTGVSLENSRASCWRYNKVWETLEKGIAVSSPRDALPLLKGVSQRNTLWSVVYDTSSLSFIVVMGKKYDQIHGFELKQSMASH